MVRTERHLRVVDLPPDGNFIELAWVKPTFDGYPDAEWRERTFGLNGRIMLQGVWRFEAEDYHFAKSAFPAKGARPTSSLYAPGTWKRMTCFIEMAEDEPDWAPAPGTDAYDKWQREKHAYACHLAEVTRLIKRMAVPNTLLAAR